MPGLIPLIRKVRPEVPIIYRSHIEIRSDLVGVPGSPQEEVWKYLWKNIQLADLFISAFLLVASWPNRVAYLLPKVTRSPSSCPAMSLSKRWLSWVPLLIGGYSSMTVSMEHDCLFLLFQARWLEQRIGPLGLPILHGRIPQSLLEGENERVAMARARLYRPSRSFRSFEGHS